MPGGSCGRMAAQTSWTRLAPPPRRRWRPRGTCRRLLGDSSAPALAPNPRPRLAGGGDCLSRGLSTTVTASPPGPPTRAARAGAHQPASTSPPTGPNVSRGPSAGQAAGPVEPSGLPINKIKLSPVRLPTLPAQPASTTTVKPPKSAQWELHLALSSHQPCVPTHSEFAVIGAPLSTRACPGPWQHSRKPGRLDV
ncbi:hypothetical protein AB1E18_012084 [Capra hircus]